ncbi:hypothetical protein [Desulfurobacterium sp.]
MKVFLGDVLKSLPIALLFGIIAFIWVAIGKPEIDILISLSNDMIKILFNESLTLFAFLITVFSIFSLVFQHEDFNAFRRSEHYNLFLDNFKGVIGFCFISFILAFLLKFTVTSYSSSSILKFTIVILSVLITFLIAWTWRVVEALIESLKR